MLKSSARPVIRLRGVRHNNLKNFDLDLPLNRLIVVTGLSGSGKSSLAFDTLFAEGQRRYVETFSPYARQFLDRMDKPQVESIEGIPPAIAVEQRNAVRTTRSTVGTMTEICDYMKSLWPHLSRLHCRNCGRGVVKDSPQEVWRAVSQVGHELVISFELPLSAKLGLQESLQLVSKQGYQRLIVDGELVRLEELGSALPESLTVVQDRIAPSPEHRARFVEACEQAYHFGKGILSVWVCEGKSVSGARRFSNRLHCAECDIAYRDPSPALFSFNHPLGACPECRGFGRIISIDYNLALPDRSKTLVEGVVKPWQTGQGAECQADLLRMCRRHGVPTNVPFQKLGRKWQDFVVDGEPGYGRDAEHEWPNAWYGVKGYFRWLESKSYKMHVRVLLSRYRAYTPCPACGGKRFQPEALLYRCGRNRENFTLADFYRLPIRDALPFLMSLAGPDIRGKPASTSPSQATDPLQIALKEACSRLEFLNQVGLGYLTLDRPTRSLSGGETERVNLTTCLGARLVNTLFVLDEPSVGLHPRDTQRLVDVLKRLRDAGNTVVVVEHEAAMMHAADEIVDLGPGHGATGGQVVYQGPYEGILSSKVSLTGQYLSGRLRIELPTRRPCGLGSAPPQSSARRIRDNRGDLVLREVGPAYAAYYPTLTISGATCHNLKNLEAKIPLERFVCVTGVSGSGKTTLVREVLLPALTAKLKGSLPDTKASDRLEPDGTQESEEHEPSRNAIGLRISGWERLNSVVLVDQSILGKTPRSNPAVYIGAFDHIRDLFAQCDVAKRRGLGASAFSFNSAQGQCERCRGAGFEKIEMQFLSDVFVRCPDCGGRRYRSHILEVRLDASSAKSLSIADLLESTVEEAIAFMGAFGDLKPATRAAAALRWLQDVGLGYLKLGQPINTLSGGESQRLKLVRHLADLAELKDDKAESQIRDRDMRRGEVAGSPERSRSGISSQRGTLFLFDEPTTGLHFEDVRVLLKVFQRLVDAGHSVLVIEHNLDVVKSADWLIDMGPEAGDQGGKVVVTGTPEDVAASAQSHTGQALVSILQPTRGCTSTRAKAL